MRGSIRRLAVFCAALSATIFGQAHAQNMPPVEAFGSLPKFSQPRLSPDGKFLAAIQEFNGEPVVTIRPTAGGAPKGTAIPGMIISYIQWVKNDRLLFTASATIMNMNFVDPKTTMSRAFTVDTSGQELAVMLSDRRSVAINSDASTVTDINLADPNNVQMSLIVVKQPGDFNFLRTDSGQDYFRRDLFNVNVRDGTSEHVVTGGEFTFEFYTDGKGHVIGRRDRSGASLVVSTRSQIRRLDNIFRYRNGDWTLVKSYDEAGDQNSGIVGVASDGKSLVQTRIGETSGLDRFDLDKGEAVETLFSHPQYDLENVITDEWTGQVIGAYYFADKPEYRYFDPQRQALQKGIEQAFPGKAAQAVSESQDRSLAIVAANSPRTPTTYYLLNRQTHVASEIAGTYPGLRESDLGEMKAYNYTARDGLRIPAFITLPPGRTARNLPAVVMPHGGPDSRTTLAFNWWAQFLANRGYVVLQPNFRGSSGYGRKFTEAGLQQWGLKMQDDITDGVNKMVADGIVDAKRICIVGASYGGYAALAGAAFTPDIYACAVSVAGISDLPEVLRESRRDSSYTSFWQSRIGSLYEDSEQLRATSPARHTDKIKAPVLLMHGENDTTVPIEQSEIMERALKQAGKKVSFVRFPGDDHNLNLATTRIKMLTEVERFLAEHIGGSKNAAN